MLRQIALMVVAAVLLVVALVTADYINDERAERERCPEARGEGWTWKEWAEC